MTNDSELLDIAVVGAGLTGAFLAGALAADGFRVQVLDKARGAGGRLSVRRTEAGPFAHGCPLSVVDACVAASPPLGAAVALTEADSTSETPLPKRLLGAAQSRFGAQVSRIKRVDGRWRLLDAGGALLARAARLVLTAPAPQSAALLKECRPDWAQQLAAVRMQPVWSLLLALPAAAKPPDFCAAGVLLGEVQAQPSSAQVELSDRRWVLRLSDRASAEHLEDEPAQLLAAVCERLGRAPEDFSYAAAHRWRYARVIEPLPEPLLHDETLQLAVCGDAFAAGAADTDLGNCLASAHALLRCWAPA